MVSGVDFRIVERRDDTLQETVGDSSDCPVYGQDLEMVFGVDFRIVERLNGAWQEAFGDSSDRPADGQDLEMVFSSSML
jgi:hypothetical protein